MVKCVEFDRNFSGDPENEKVSYGRGDRTRQFSRAFSLSLARKVGFRFVMPLSKAHSCE
jgi:hypothetical protein